MENNNKMVIKNWNNGSNGKSCSYEYSKTKFKSLSKFNFFATMYTFG